MDSAPARLNVSPSRPGNALEKLAQLWLYGIALLAIWGGVLSLAFAEGATEQNFLILGVGGLVSAGIAITLVEIQRRKGSREIHKVHDYLLGLAFFFAAVGTLWGARYLISLLAANDVGWLIADGDTYSDSGWSPSANAIYVQLVLCAALIIGECMYLERLKGDRTFSWSVATFTPLGLAVVGVGPWLSWANHTVSYELGISIVTLCGLAMLVALRSNRSMVFAIVAVTSGLLPILYEILNEDVAADGVGGALSLMVFIIIIQAIMAANHRISHSLIQTTSLFLVGEVVFAMIIAKAEVMNLHLGPIKASTLGDAAVYLTLPVVLWLTVLIAYFPATHERRTPWMPILLAASLFIFSLESAVIPWIITLLMMPYMLLVAQATRRWVANCTVVAASVAFFLRDWAGGIDSVDPAITFGMNGLELLIPAVLVVVTGIAQYKNRLSSWAHNLTIGLVTLSNSVLMGDGILLPWIVVTYLFVQTGLAASKAAMTWDFEDRKNLSLASITSLLLTLILAIAERLRLPEDWAIEEHTYGINIILLFVAVCFHLTTFRHRKLELDFGHLFSWFAMNNRRAIPIYDPERNGWVVPETEAVDKDAWKEMGWGIMARPSMVFPVLLFGVGVATVEISSLTKLPLLNLLLAIPIIAIINEMMKDDGNTSHSRACAAWLIFLALLPSMFNNLMISEDEGLHLAPILHDLMLLSAPILVSIFLLRKGLDDERLSERADDATLLGILALSAIGSTGGLAFYPLLALAFYRAIIHKRAIPLIFAPVLPLICAEKLRLGYENLFSKGNGADWMFLDSTPPHIAGLLMAAMALITIGFSIKAGRENADENPYPFYSQLVWAAMGLLLGLPDLSWLILVIALGVTFLSWVSGKLEFLPWSPFVIWMGMFMGLSNDSNFADLDGWERISYSFLFSGAISLLMAEGARTGILVKFAKPADEDSINNSVFATNTSAGREMMYEHFQRLAVAGLLLSWDVYYGLGTLLGAIWITMEVFKHGQRNALLVMPMIQMLAIWNTANKFEIDFFDFNTFGYLLIGIGVATTFISAKPEISLGWKIFEFEADSPEFNQWLERAGMIGMGYTLLGAGIAFADAELWQLMWAFCAIYLGAIGVIGFRDETAAGWKRGIGAFGAIACTFFLALTIDSATYRALTFVMIGLVAFGFGVLYMYRAGDGEGTVYVEERNADEGEIYVQPAITKEIPVAITEMVVEETVEEVEEEEIVEEAEEEEIEESTLEGITTDEGWLVDLPADIIANIRNAVANTPHEGFTPMIGFSPTGQVFLDFKAQDQ